MLFYENALYKLTFGIDILTGLESIKGSADVINTEKRIYKTCAITPSMALQFCRPMKLFLRRRHFHTDYLTKKYTFLKFLNAFPKWTPGIIAAARLAKKAGIVSLLRDYDARQHEPELGMCDYTYALIAPLHLLPSGTS